MVRHNRFILLFTLLFNRTLALELGMGLLKELASFPLKDNPFFAKVVALGGNFNSEAIIDLTLDSTGYDCQMLGDLDCDEEDFPKCSGLGYIDCTNDCPGTEEEFKYFQLVMQDDQIKEKYPLISAQIGKDKKKEMPDEMAETDLKEEPKENAKMMFLKSLQSCSNFSQSTQALLSMAGGSGGGMQFGANSEDPNDLTYVAPSAVSNISQIEYDYSDYYDDIEEETETSKIRRDASNEETSMNETKAESPKTKPKKVEAKTKTRDKHEKMKDHMRKDDKKGPVKDNSLAMKKKEYNAKTNGLEDYKDLSEAERENMNMIRSVADDLEMSETNLTSEQENNTHRLVKREIEGLRSLFYSAVSLIRSGQVRSKRNTESLSLDVARKMESARLKETEGGTMEVRDYCVVRNMTCLSLPTRAQCSGLGVGRCGTMRDMLVKLFTPHVVMVSVVSLIVIVMVTVGLSYYCYKLKSENRVEPSEQDEPERSNGAVVKNVVSAPTADNA